MRINIKLVDNKTEKFTINDPHLEDLENYRSLPQNQVLRYHVPFTSELIYDDSKIPLINLFTSAYTKKIIANRIYADVSLMVNDLVSANILQEHFHSFERCETWIIEYSLGEQLKEFGAYIKDTKYGTLWFREPSHLPDDMHLTALSLKTLIDHYKLPR